MAIFSRWISLGADVAKMDLARCRCGKHGSKNEPRRIKMSQEEPKMKPRWPKEEGRKKREERRRKKEEKKGRRNKEKKQTQNQKIYIFKLPINRTCGIILVS